MTTLSMPFLKTSDSTHKVPRLDSSTHGQIFIDYEHHEVHDGSAFTCNYSNDVTNIGEMTAIAFNTPNTTTYIHLTFTAEATGGATFALYEAPSIDVDEGTALPIYNRNRNSATTSTITSIATTPVANSATSFNETQAAGANITTTTRLLYHIIGSGGNQPTAGQTRAQTEFVLKKNTQYAVVMSSLTNDDASHTITLVWYEHADKGA
jgi:hypothetical protein